jgi:hypothetical protein
MTLDENDYLAFQLYTASKSPRVKNMRRLSWLVTTLAFASLAFLFFANDNRFLFLYFSVCAVLCLLFYPLFSRWRYKRHYQKHVRDTFKNRIGEKTDLVFDENSVTIKDRSGEVKVNKTAIEEINEIRDYYFIKSRSGACVILSKSKSPDIAKIKAELDVMIQKQGVKHNLELDWKWR